LAMHCSCFACCLYHAGCQFGLLQLSYLCMVDVSKQVSTVDVSKQLSMADVFKQKIYKRLLTVFQSCCFRSVMMIRCMGVCLSTMLYHCGGKLWHKKREIGAFWTTASQAAGCPEQGSMPYFDTSTQYCVILNTIRNMTETIFQV